MRRALAVALIVATAAASPACGSPTPEDTSCGDGKGTWLQDESAWLSDGDTVTVRICVDDGGNVIDLEVD